MARDLCAGVWVGGEDRCIHFRNLALGGGAHTAMPIWENFMMRIYADAELPYKKESLLNYAKPFDIVIPSQHEQSQCILPAQETEQEEDVAMEETAVDINLDVNEIF